MDNSQPLDAVGRGSEVQLRVAENLNYSVFGLICIEYVALQFKTLAFML